MKLRCVSKKTAFNNLTVNTEYEGIEEGDVYIVQNNAGLRARYAKQYFRVVPEAAPAPVIRTLAEACTVVINDNSDLVITLNRTTRTINLDDALNHLDCCGIKEFCEISRLKAVVSELINNKVATITGTKAELFRMVMDVLLTWLRENDPAMVYIFTDVNDRPGEAEMNDVLTELAGGVVTEGTNPNSNHQLSLWLIG
jgi:hypothetical protein